MNTHLNFEHFQLTIKPRYWMFFAIFIGLLTVGANVNAASKVIMAFSESSAPYAIKEGNTGIDVDLIRAALALNGHELEAVFVPAGRILSEFGKSKVNAIAQQVVFPAEGTDASSFDKPGFYHGDTSVQLHDVFVSLADASIEFNDAESLSQYRVMAFQTASDIYKQWLEPVATAGRYRELANQEQQLKMLFRGRVDVLIIDKWIAGHLAQEVNKQNTIKVRPLRIKEFSTPLNYRPAFQDETIRDDFNEGLLQLKFSGQYDAIIDGYAKSGLDEFLVKE